MNNLQKNFFKNLTEHEKHTVLKDELNWIEEFPISSQAQWEFHYIHFHICIDIPFFKKAFYFKMPTQVCWTRNRNRGICPSILYQNEGDHLLSDTKI